MRKVTVDVAEAGLALSIEAALAGEDVVVTSGETPVIRRVPIPHGKFRFGLLEPGSLGDGPDGDTIEALFRALVHLSSMSGRQPRSALAALLEVGIQAEALSGDPCVDRRERRQYEHRRWEALMGEKSP